MRTQIKYHFPRYRASLGLLRKVIGLKDQFFTEILILINLGQSLIKTLIVFMEHFIWFAHTGKYVIVVTVGSDAAPDISVSKVQYQLGEITVQLKYLLFS